MENLGIDGKLLLAQMINFILFFILVKQFMVKPFTSFMNQERKNEEEKNRMLEKLRISEEAGIEAEKKMKERMKKEFDVLFIQAKKEAQNMRDDLIKQAESDALEIKKKNNILLAEEKNLLYREIKDKIIRTSLTIVESSLKDSLDESSRKKVTGTIIKNYEGNVNLN